MFNRGDKVRALVTTTYPDGSGDNVTKDQIYTVSRTAPPSRTFLEGLFGMFEAYFFELVQTNGQPNAYNSLPAVVPYPDLLMIPTTDQGSNPAPHDNFWSVPPVPQRQVKCECGVDSIGGGKHSSYCPKHN